MDLRIRKMESKDLDVVKSIDKLAFPNPWPENAYNYELDQNPNARLWVVEDQQGLEKSVIGFAVVWVVIDEAHIGTFAIHPDFQNHGIGKKFLSYICKELVDENIYKIFLEVRQSNRFAIRLYEKFGFVIDGERKHYYRDNGESALLMSCTLKRREFYLEMDTGLSIQNSKRNREVIS